MLRRSLLLGAALAAALAAGAAQAAEKVTLRYATFVPEQSLTNTKIIKPFLDQVVAESEGTLDYKIFSGGSLGKNPAQQLKLVQDGIADMAFVVPSYLPGVYDNYNVSQLPTLAENAEQGSVGLWNAYASGLLKTPEDVVMIGLFTNAPNMIHTKPEISGIDSLKGMKMRAAGQVQSAVIERLAAAPVGNIPVPGAAEAISRGVVEGTLLDWAAVATFRVSEVAKYHLEMPLGMVGIMIPMNKKVFDDLPAPARKALEKHMGEPFARLAGKAFDSFVISSRTRILKEPGQTVVPIDAAEKKRINDMMQSVVDAWLGQQAGRDKVVDAYRSGVAKATTD